MNLNDIPQAHRPAIMARLAESDGDTARAVVEKLQRLTLSIAQASLEAETLAASFPCLHLPPITFAAIRGATGTAWHALELAEARL